jgi:hypothetical protein
MTATSCTALEALKALQFGCKVRCIAWADGRYVEMVADRITLNDKATHVLTQNSVLQDLVLNNQWEILDY